MRLNKMSFLLPERIKILGIGLSDFLNTFLKPSEAQCHHASVTVAKMKANVFTESIKF